MHKKLTDVEKMIANNFKIARKLRGLTLEDLGKILGITGQQVQKYEVGLSRIPLDKLIITSTVLKFDMEFFLKKFKI